MALRHQRALHGLLFSIIVATSIFMGLSAVSRGGADQPASAGFRQDALPLASDTPLVPEWSKINHTMLNIDTQEVPAASVIIPTGVSGVQAAVKERVFNKRSSINATNTRTTMLLNYTDVFSVNCTGLFAGSNYSVWLKVPIVNASIDLVNQTLISNAKSIKITWTNGTSVASYSFAFDFNVLLAPLNNTYYYNVTLFSNTGHFFRFNAANASLILASRPLEAGFRFLFEVNYVVPIEFSSWSMGTKAGENFRIVGVSSTRLSNYTVSFRVSAQQGVSITFHYVPADRAFTSGHKFYYKTNNTPFSPSQEPAGWKIAPGGMLELNATGIPFKVEFRANSTVGFVDQKFGQWTSDEMSTRSDTRTRKFNLQVLAGASTLLVERVQFTVNDIAYTAANRITRYVTPGSSITLTDDTYTVYDPVLQDEVTRSNGTKVLIGRMQGQNGTVTASFSYNASYSAILVVRDEVRNPIKGAEVTLYFHGIRFGPLMATNDSRVQARKLSDGLGRAVYDFLPQGNYSVEVHYEGRVTVQEFSVYGDTRKVVVDIVTDVPYQAWILVTWIAIFGTVFVLAVILFKRKR